MENTMASLAMKNDLSLGASLSLLARELKGAFRLQSQIR